MTNTSETNLPEAFYLPVGDDEFDTTPATASAWGEGLQHGGPPSALLARAMERCEPKPDMPLARVTVDLLGPVPQGRIRTEARVLRPGKRVELLEAQMWADDRLVVSATGWRIVQTPGISAQFATLEPELPPIPDESSATYFRGQPSGWGYGDATDWRFVEGAFDQTGPAMIWTRVKIPLVAGEQISPIQRMLVTADSTNGVSAEIQLGDWFFIPPSVSVTIQREPASEWLFFEAATTIGENGTGIARGSMFDEMGLVSRIEQPLLVAPR